MVMRRLVVAALLCLVCSCEHDAFEKSPKANGLVVERIFEHGGCTGFRFYDDGDHYYVVCGRHEVTTASEKCVSCGKNCTHCFDEEVPTVVP